MGEEVGYNDVPPEMYRSFGFPGAEDLGNMFQFKRDFEEMYCGARNLERRGPSILSFRLSPAGWPRTEARSPSSRRPRARETPINKCRST